MNQPDSNKVQEMVRSESYLQSVDDESELALQGLDPAPSPVLRKHGVSVRGGKDNWTLTFCAVLFVCMLALAYVLMARQRVSEVDKENARLNSRVQELNEKIYQLETERRVINQMTRRRLESFDTKPDSPDSFTPPPLHQDSTGPIEYEK